MCMCVYVCVKEIEKDSISTCVLCAKCHLFGCDSQTVIKWRECEDVKVRCHRYSFLTCSVPRVLEIHVHAVLMLPTRVDGVSGRSLK